MRPPRRPLATIDTAHPARSPGLSARREHRCRQPKGDVGGRRSEFRKRRADGFAPVKEVDGVVAGPELTFLVLALENLGIRFLATLARAFIHPPFPPTHVSGRNHPDERAANREYDRQQPPRIQSGRAPRTASPRSSAVRLDQDRSVEEGMFTLRPRPTRWSSQFFSAFPASHSKPLQWAKSSGNAAMNGYYPYIHARVKVARLCWR